MKQRGTRAVKKHATSVPRPMGRPPKPLPDRIPDTPESIMRALVSTPPRKDGEWDYLKSSKKR